MKLLLKVIRYCLRGKIIRSLWVLSILLLPQISRAQVVGLDNWYNRETHHTTGLPFHYLWTDQDMSGYSQWGELFIKHGASITTIENEANSKNLASLDIYIIVDPDTTTESESPNYIQAADRKAIQKWVKKGGILVLMSNDGPNCEFTHLNLLAEEFGIHFNHVSLNPVKNREWDMGAFTSFTQHPIFEGVSKIYMKEISSLRLEDPAEIILSEDGNAFMAEVEFGKGMVLAIGDPWIYNEYIDHKLLPADFDNYKAAENLTLYLIHKSGH